MIDRKTLDGAANDDEQHVVDVDDEAGAMASPPPPRLLNSLARLRCSIFNTSYNPTSTRTGAKYLRARLRGPSMVEYYPPRDEMSIGALNRMYKGWNLVDVDEVRREISVRELKERGKGAPKKAKDKCAKPISSQSGRF